MVLIFLFFSIFFLVSLSFVERLRFLVSLNLCYLIKDHDRFVCYATILFDQIVYF